MNHTQAFSLLKISSTATKKDIRKAYHQKCLKHHPDKGGSDEAFQRVQEAYEFLSRPPRYGYYPYNKGFNSPEKISKRHSKLEMHQKKAIKMNKFYEKKYGAISHIPLRTTLDTDRQPEKGKVRCACGDHRIYANARLHKAMCPVENGPLRAAAFAVANGIINDNASFVIHTTGKYTFFEVEESFPL